MVRSRTAIEAGPRTTEEARLVESVRRFRLRANLHDGAPVDALVEYARGAGCEAPGAVGVRDAADDLDVARAVERSMEASGETAARLRALSADEIRSDLLC